jgi:hypothetical protein
MKCFKSWIERTHAVFTGQLPYLEETTLKRNGDVLLSLMLLGSESTFKKPTTLAPKEGTITKPKKKNLLSSKVFLKSQINC